MTLTITIVTITQGGSLVSTLPCASPEAAGVQIVTFANDVGLEEGKVSTQAEAEALLSRWEYGVQVEERDLLGSPGSEALLALEQAAKVTDVFRDDDWIFTRPDGQAVQRVSVGEMRNELRHAFKAASARIRALMEPSANVDGEREALAVSP